MGIIVNGNHTNYGIIMLNIVLYQPEIPPNTGNIIRLASNSGCRLHLIEPLGFTIDDKHLRRAGLDYHQGVPLIRHKNYQQFCRYRAHHSPQARHFGVSTRARQPYHKVTFAHDDYFLFGPETRGLPHDILCDCTQTLRIPMSHHSRSINLANAVAIVVYEAWRQLDFAGAK